MTENIKHMRQIIEHNDLTNETTRAEALAVLDFIELDWREAKAEEEMSDRLRRTLADILTATANVLKGPPGELKEHSWHDLPDRAKIIMDLAYHTAPGELEFAPEGWTWKQQAARDYDRLINAERENEHLKQCIADLEGTIGNALT